MDCVASVSSQDFPGHVDLTFSSALQPECLTGQARALLWPCLVCVITINIL